MANDGNGKEVKERLLQNRRIGHQVPAVLQERRSSAAFIDEPTTVPKRLTHAERAKTLLFRQKAGYLSTLALEDGSPFGSIVNFAFDVDGNVFFVASKLAEHTANLEKDPRASLLVTEEQGEGDKLATQRVTVVGKIEKVEKTKYIVSAFRERHPTAAYVLFDDFFAFKFNPVARVRYIAGFGEMSWVDAAKFVDAQPDPVSKDAKAIRAAVSHMNEDHVEANLLLVNKFAVPGLPSPAKTSTMLSIDRFGIDFLTETSDGRRMARVPFENVLTNPSEIQAVIVAMTKKARL